jgi:uncharacterized protein (DUF2384 family)
MIKLQNGNVVDENTLSTDQLIDEIMRIFSTDPNWIIAWKNTPNALLGSARPVDLIGTNKEHILRNELLGILYGSFS